MSILGIRSFDNQRSEAIQFFSPLTLIVGSNGSGKTTIVECLKYVTTGILPSNSKTGGAFIHDPKLCGEKEVMAQVKLAFQASTGFRMVATRSLQLSVKKTARSQKTLEGLLLMLRNGERITMSTRIAELDTVIPQSLGVSTAVLDNVIFCHQDDSLWPLSEPANLKKKFDEIFEAQKYTKAIENIKQLRKKQNEELAKYKIMEQHAREDKDRAQRAKKKTIQLHNEIEELRIKSHDLEQRMAKARELADKAWKEAESYSQILGTLEGKRIEVRSKETTIRDLKIHLQEVPESDEWLQSTLDEFDMRLEQYQEQRQVKQEAYMERKEVIDTRRGELLQKHNERGEQEHAKADHNRQTERRKDMIRAVASQQGLRGYDDLSDDSLIDDFMFKIRKLSKEQHAALDRARSEANSERRDAQSLLNRLTERQAALKDSKQSARDLIALNERQAKEYQTRVNEISVDEGNRAAIESRIDSANNQLQSLRTASVQKNWDQAIKDANQELHSHEEDTARLNMALIQGTKKAGEMARISHLKQEVKDRTRSLKTLKDTHTDRINKLIGHEWDVNSCEQVHQQAVESATQDLSSAERERDTVARELEQVQFKMKTVRDSLEQKKGEMKTCEAQVRKVLDGSEPSEYQNIVNAMQNNLDIMKSNASNASGLVKYFESILQVAQPPKLLCRVCERPFTGGESDPSLLRMKKKVQGLIKKAAMEVNEEEIKAAEAELKEVVDAAVPLEVYNRLKEKEIPALQDEQDNLSRQRQNLNTKIEDHDKVVERCRLSVSELEQIGRPVASISKCQAEILSFESQIQELLSKQSQHGEVHTLEDIQKEISTFAEKIQTIKTRISQLTSEKESSRTQLSNLELELSDLKNQLNTTSFQLEKKESLMARVEEYKTLNQKQRELIDKADRDIEALEPEIATAQAKYDDLAQRAESRERDLSRKCSEISDSINALNLVNDQIQSYVDLGVPEKLANTTREIKRIEQDIKTLESEQNEITREINKISEQLRDSESTKRQYSDNLRYRQESRALERLNAEIVQLAAHNAEVDRDRFQEESAKWTREHNRLSGEVKSLMGQMISKDAQLGELLEDFKTDFTDAPKRYKESHIRVETTKAAVEDLGRYATALEKAIMKYHGIKMEEVNRIIEELWRRTYRGTDVDYIMIKTESEKAGSRSYSYRVVMVKQDAEMDMRGRCSAGQKVLASIIIRLALAECFGSNCGLIALDEPTTNLDHENISSLAESLHDIIKYRQQQANFQLIVITHDEEFLRQMHCGDFADYYYRVDRNEKLKSVIERQRIAEVL